MADQKKPKIDLKSRLGKKSVTTSGGAVLPPPVGIPKPAVPGLATPSRPAGPIVDSSDPYAAISSDVAPARAEPQAIKVEMSAEVVAAQRKGKARVLALIVAAAVVAGLLGFTFGDRYQSNQGAKVALAGAEELVGEVEAANAEARKLDDLLKATLNKLRDNEFPAAEVKQLGDINIPFGGPNLVGKGIGRFNQKTLMFLIQYSSGAQEANDAKDKLQGIMAFLRKPIQEVLAQQNETTRKVEWSLFVVNGPHGPWAAMQPLDEKQRFLVSKKGGDYKWPEKFKIKDGGREVELERYTKGEPMGSSPRIIPVDPTSQAGVCASDELRTLSVEVGRLQKVLAGDKSDPQHEKQGLMEIGDNLVEELKKIGQP